MDRQHNSTGAFQRLLCLAGFLAPGMACLSVSSSMCPLRLLPFLFSDSRICTSRSRWRWKEDKDENEEEVDEEDIDALHCLTWLIVQGNVQQWEACAFCCTRKLLQSILLCAGIQIMICVQLRIIKRKFDGLDRKTVNTNAQ